MPSRGSSLVAGIFALMPLSVEFPDKTVAELRTIEEELDKMISQVGLNGAAVSTTSLINEGESFVIVLFFIWNGM